MNYVRCPGFAVFPDQTAQDFVWLCQVFSGVPIFIGLKKIQNADNLTEPEPLSIQIKQGVGQKCTLISRFPDVDEIIIGLKSGGIQEI